MEESGVPWGLKAERGPSWLATQMLFWLSMPSAVGRKRPPPVTVSDIVQSLGEAVSVVAKGGVVGIVAKIAATFWPGLWVMLSAAVKVSVGALPLGGVAAVKQRRAARTGAGGAAVERVGQGCQLAGFNRQVGREALRERRRTGSRVRPRPGRRW